MQLKIMKVVSTSNLVSSEKQKKKVLIFKPWLQILLFCNMILLNGNLFIYANMKLFVVSWRQNCE